MHFSVLLLSNFLLYALAQYLGLERVVVNFDYFIIIILLTLQYKKIANLLFIVVFCSDILLLIRQIFPFFRLNEVVYISQFLWLSSIYYQIMIFLLLLFVSSMLYLQSKVKLARQATFYIFTFAALAFCTQSVYSTWQNTQPQWIQSQLIEFLDRQFGTFQQALNEDQQDLTDLPVSLATKDLREQLQSQNFPHGVLLIINESLGYPKNPHVLEAMLQPLTAQKKYLSNWQLSKATYVAATVQGELRELCAKTAQNFNLKNLNHGFEACLPQQFKKQGYQTTALHGALGVMYDRIYWYPRAGFERMIFRESHIWQQRCYSFPGACDRELVQQVSNTFQRPEKQFFYWLTLNTHAIYDLRDLKVDLFNCKKYEIDPKSESCRNLKLQTQFFDTLASLVQQPHMQGVEVIVVGDHTPMIFNTVEKKQHFDGSNVTLLKFKISS